jgi:amino acid permease
VNWIKNYKNFNFSVWIGFVLMFVALAIWLISAIELTGNEIMLTHNLSIEEVWRYEGALNWWKTIYSTAIIPTTAILALSGMLSITSQRLISRFMQKDSLKNLEITLQQACKTDAN